MYFRVVVLSLYIVILIERSSLELFDLVEQVASKMPTGGEVDTAMEEDRINEIKKEKRNRKTAVTKTRHNLERLSANHEDFELIQGEIGTLGAVLEKTLHVMDELQKAYRHLGGGKENKKVGRGRSRGFGERSKHCY